MLALLLCVINPSTQRDTLSWRENFALDSSARLRVIKVTEAAWKSAAAGGEPVHVP